LKRNLKTFKDIYDLLPGYLKVKNKADVDNIEHISNATNGNTIRALSSAINENEADKRGRGITSPLQFWDEAAFLKYNKIIYGEDNMNCRIKIFLIAGISLELLKLQHNL